MAMGINSKAEFLKMLSMEMVVPIFILMEIVMMGALKVTKRKVKENYR